MDAGLISDCVHCGFCLPSCPTYELWHEEMDSPRGRIWLMKATVEGTLELDRTVAEHFDRCLGCMACLTSCPSGVQYDRLIELARERVEQEVPRPLRERVLRSLVFAVLPHPAADEARAPLLGAPGARSVQAAQGARSTVAGARVAARPHARLRRADRPRRAAHRLCPVGAVRRGQPRVGEGARRLRVRGHRAVRGLLRRARSPRRAARAGTRARPPQADAAFVAAGADVIVTNAAGCGSHLKDAQLEPRGPRHPRGARARPRSRASSARAASRLPGVVPPRPRPARARRASLPPPLDPGARARRAGRAGALLRKRRDLQPRAARGSANARRPQGREGPRHRARPLRQREPRLSPPGLGRAPPGRAGRSRRRIRSSSSTPRSARRRRRGASRLLGGT